MSELVRFKYSLLLSLSLKKKEICAYLITSCVSLCHVNLAPKFVFQIPSGSGKFRSRLVYHGTVNRGIAQGGPLQNLKFYSNIESDNPDCCA